MHRLACARRLPDTLGLTANAVPTQDDKNRFFGREHLIRAGWIILIGLVGFVAAAIYYKFISPPKIIIDDQRQQPIPVTVKESNRGEPGPSADEVKGLTEELRKLRDAYNRQLQEARRSVTASKRDHPTPEPAPVRPVVEPALPDVRALTEEVARLRDALTKHQASAVTLTPKESSPPPQVPLFRLPTTVKGYRPISFFGVIGSTCPPDSLKRGEQIKVAFTVTDRSLLNSATPLFARITRKKDNKYVLRVFERLYDLNDGLNQLSLTVDLQPADYELEYGFYLRAELNEEFPKYYRRNCDFAIAQSAIVGSGPS